MRYLFLVFGLLCGASAFAQTSTTFSLPDIPADNGTNVCLPVTVVNFTGGIEFGFSLAVDPGGALSNPTITNISGDIPGFSLADFDLTSYVASGIITVRWRNWDPDAGETCEDAPTTITLDDGTILFEVCYDVNGGVATQHPVEFFNKPDSDPNDGIDDSAPVIFNKRAQCNMGNDAFPGIDDGSVTIGVSPLELTVVDDDGIYQPGDIYCVDVVAVSGFENLKGYQFGMQFDNTVLRAVSATANTVLPQNTDGGYNLFGGDAFYGIWAPFGDLSETLPDGTSLVTVCFEVIGDCSSRTDLTIGTIPASSGGVRPVEANGSGTGLTTIPVVTGGTRLVVDNCNPAGFDVIVDCPDTPVNFGDTDVCIAIRAGDDFIDMTDIDYLITWDPGVLQYSRVQNFNSGLINLNNDEFILDQISNGVLGFEWEAFNSTATETLSEGEIVFEVCFDAVGFGGISPITIADFNNDIRANNVLGSFRGLNPSNCAIEVLQPDGVAVNFPDVGFSSSQESCFDIEVDEFNDVTSFSLFVGYAANLFEYTNFVAAVPGVTATLVTDGLVSLNYSGPTLNLPNGTALGSMCLMALGDANPTDCDVIGLAGFIPSSVVTNESAGNSVSIESFDGEACVLFPNGYGLIAGDANGFIMDEVCVPFSVTRFTDVVDTDFNITFDRNLLSYSSFNNSGTWPGLSVANLDASDAGIGVLNINWSSGDGSGTSIATTDTVTVFEICFTASTTPDCTEIELSDGAAPATNTVTGAGSIVYNEADVCIEDRLVLLDIRVVPATCDDTDDGMIIFEVEQRPGNEDVFIRVDNPVRFGSSEGGTGPNGGITGTIGGLLPGPQNYIIYDQFSTVSFSGTIEVGVNPDNAAVAMAGEDQTLSCGDNPSTVISSQGNVGETFELFFLQSDGITRSELEGTVGAGGNIVGLVTDPGTYILEVTSEQGCTATDTVRVIGIGQPIAQANGDINPVIDCNNPTVILDGDGSSTGGNVSYSWDLINAEGDVIQNVGNGITATADRAGRYRLTVEFVDLQCTSTDIVIVLDQTQIPNSILPTSANLNCDGTPVTLSIGDAEDNVEYDWARIETPGNVLGNSNTFSVDQTGTYVAMMNNTLTGCMRTDTVVVEESTGFPTTTFAANLTLGCDPDTTVLTPTYTNVNETTTYSWNTTTGRVVVTDLSLPNPRIVLPGTYRVIVANGECRDTSFVEVGAPALPTVEAGMGGELPCTTEFLLMGSGSSNAGNGVNFQWFLEGEEVMMGNAAVIPVTSPGTYFLQATDDVTGCVAIDSVEVLPPSGLPVYALQDTVTGLGCQGDMIFLTVDADDLSYTYLWSNPFGLEIGENATVGVSEAGIYTVVITNPATGCSVTEEVEVIADATTPPFVAFNQNTLDITCVFDGVIIDASPSVDGNDFQYVWENIVDGETPEIISFDSVRVNTAGTYRLTVTNLATNCASSREITITDSREFPNVVGIDGDVLDCDVRETVLSLDIQDQPNDYQIQWAGSAGTDPLPTDTTSVTVTQGGEYIAVIINPITSCVSTVEFRVEDLADSIATLTIMPTDSFDCNNTTITIDASDSELNNASPDGILWTSLDGNTITPATGSLIVSVNGPGAYELSVMDASGCTVRDTVNVPAARDTPFAQAGEDVDIDCGEMIQLDGSASSPLPGGNVLYSWTASDGGIIENGDDTSMPIISAPGTYQLVVTNLTNGCADTSVTIVSLLEQEPAMLPTPFTTCETPVVITGNLPVGTTGAWSTFNDDGAIVSFNNDVATITDIADGISLVWTLSKPGCEDYSSDTTRVSPEAAPNANDDALQVGGTNNIGTVNVLANDQRTGPVTVTLLNDPEFGEILSNLNGEITFEAPVGFTGTTTIDYEICSTVCEGLCDQATILIRSDANGADPTVYNAITPNGDGLNETFVFDILNLRPDDFPDNELIIFNRWGDVIFDAKPYNNDWDGVSNAGTQVPEGTYYYILRLNIGQGEIIRGDVTVIR